MNSDSTIPLFPLPMVVAPGERVALHIFETRYKEMIARCLQLEAAGASGEFVIACSLDGSTALVGTRLRIEQVLRTYDDGRSDLIVRGLRRCAITEVRDEHAFQTAEVEPLADDDPDWDEALATVAVRLHRKLVGLVSQAEPGDAFYHGKSALSFALLPTSGLTPHERQEVLEMRSENGRLAYLVNHLEDLLQRITDSLNAIASIHTGWEMAKSSASGDQEET